MSWSNDNISDLHPWSQKTKPKKEKKKKIKDFRGKELEKKDFNGEFLQDALLQKANLRQANFNYAHLEGAHLEEAHLEEAHLEFAHLQGAYLEGAFLEGANLLHSNLQEAHLDGLDLRKVKNLASATLYDAHLKGVDLREVVLRGVDLRGADLEGAKLEGADLERAHLERVILNRVDLRTVKFKGANLLYSHFEEADLKGVDLKSLRLNSANFKNAHLEGAHLEKADLSVAHFEGAFLIETYLQEAVLPHVYFKGAHLERAHLEKAFLEDAHFEEAFLQGAFLQRANLRKADLKDAHLEGAHFEGTILREANLQGAHLERANLTGAVLEGADLRGAYLNGTIFNEVDLRRVDLNGVDLREADLRGANLGGIDLRGLMLSGIQLEAFQELERARQQRIAQIAESRLPRQIPFLSSQQRHYFDSEIIIPRTLHTPRDFGFGNSKNSSNKSCPDFRKLYDFIMEQHLAENFWFKFEGERAIDLTGLTRIIFDKILPVYSHLFFEKQRAEDFILLKEDVNMQILDLNTIQLIKLAKAAHAQIVLKIHPLVIELLSKENPKENIATRQNFDSLYANFKKEISAVKAAGLGNSNFLLKNNSLNQQNESLENINSLTREVQAEIILRKKLFDFGFKSWEQFHNMTLFIKKFWNTSGENKVTITKNRRQITVDLFVPELKFDIESFKGRLKITTSEGTNIDLNKAISVELLASYPALRPLLEYIFHGSPEGDNRRKIFTKYCAGTEYYPGELKILLSRQRMSPALYNGSPFYGHTCDTRVDLFIAPSGFNRELTVNAINIALKANTSSLAASE
jgi:uncharacterized protein YjbI with pentapeptide repeats